MNYKITDKSGKEHFCTTEKGNAFVDGETKPTSVIIESDKTLEKFIGKSIMTLITVCAIKGYDFEKIG